MRPRSGAELRAASPALQSLAPSDGAARDRRAVPARDRAIDLGVPMRDCAALCVAAKRINEH